MGRKRIIGQDEILDAAEQVIREHGGHQLSLHLVAEAARISKGAIAYNFKTKDDLLRAVFARELSRFEREAARDTAIRNDGKVEAATSADTGSDGEPQDIRPVERAMGWISATRRENEGAIVKAAGLLTNMLQSETRREAAIASYQRMLSGIDVSTREGRAALVAFMAVEGLFLLRGLGALRISEEQWQEWLDVVRDTCLETA